MKSQRVAIRKVGRGYKGYDFYCKKCRINLRNGESKLCADCQEKNEKEKNKESKS